VSDTPITDASILESKGHWSFALRDKMETLERKNAAQKAALAKASASLSAFLGFHAEALPLEAVRGLSELVKEIQPFLKP
jgi:hypothetical protein